MAQRRDASGRFVGSGFKNYGGGLKIRVELIPEGIIELLQSADIEDDLDRRGHAVASRAGLEDYASNTWTGFDRARCTVRPVTYKGRLDEAKSKRLTTALDAARQ